MDRFLEIVSKFPIVFLSDISVIIPIIFFSLTKKNGKEQKYLLGYLIVVFLRNILGYFMILVLNAQNNLIVINVALLLKFVFISRYYISFFSQSEIRKNINYITIAFTVFFFLDFLTSNPKPFDFLNHRLNKYSYILESIIIITGILFYFYRILIEVKVPNLLRFTNFWICSGILLYHAGTSFVNLFLYEIFTWGNNLDVGMLEYLPNFLEIVQFAFISIGLWLHKEDMI